VVGAVIGAGREKSEPAAPARHRTEGDRLEPGPAQGPDFLSNPRPVPVAGRGRRAEFPAGFLAGFLADFFLGGTGTSSCKV
jgi:hypothetical protein